MALLGISQKSTFLNMELPRFTVQGTSDFIIQVKVPGAAYQTPHPSRALGYIELKTPDAFKEEQATRQTHLELIAANRAAPRCVCGLHVGAEPRKHWQDPAARGSRTRQSLARFAGNPYHFCTRAAVDLCGVVDRFVALRYCSGDYGWGTARILSRRLKPFVVLTDTHNYRIFWQNCREIWSTEVLRPGAAWSLIKSMLMQVQIAGGMASVVTLPGDDPVALPPLKRTGVGVPGPSLGDVGNLADVEGVEPE